MDYMVVVIVVTIVFLALWMALVLFAMSEARSMLSKYDNPLPWIHSRSITSAVRNLREIKDKGVVEKEDVGEYKFIMIILKGTFIVFPLCMLLFLATLLVRQ